MKRLWIAAALGVLLILLGVLQHRDTVRYCRTAKAQLTQCAQLITDGQASQAAQLADAVQHDFLRWRTRASLFFRAELLQPLNEALAELCACAETGAYGDFVRTCRRAELLVLQLDDTVRLRWHNLL